MLANGQDNALIRFGLGSAYVANEEPQHAVEHLNEAIHFDENYSAAWKLLGKAYQALGQDQQARATFDRGIEIARRCGDMQAVREMEVFKRRINKPAK